MYTLDFAQFPYIENNVEFGLIVCQLHGLRSVLRHTKTLLIVAMLNNYTGEMITLNF